jgi:glycine/D-amino acid oxidase-like deaminating enzyme
MQLSYWEKKHWFNEIDVTIIGSGIVGLYAAYFLKVNNPGLNILVTDRSFLPYGASTRNAGFACFGSVSELLDDFSKESEDEVLSRVEKRWNGLNGLKKLIGIENLCYEQKGGFEIFTKEDNYSFQKCNDSINYLNKKLKTIIGIAPYLCVDEKISSFGFNQVTHLIANSEEGQIDTGRMIDCLLEKVKTLGVKVINGLSIKKMESNGKDIDLLTHADFKITTRCAIVCTNGFAKELLPELNVIPGRAQVLITSVIENLKVSGTFHYQQGYYYFRDVDNRLLFGGGRNLDFEGETTTQFGQSPLIQDSLERILKEIILPDSHYEIEQRWSGIMGLGENKSPIIKKLFPGVYCAVRMGGMGVALGYETGKEVAELVLQEI